MNSRHLIYKGWLVHAFTASGAICGLLSLEAIMQGNYLRSFWYMAAAIAIDGIDGTFARRVNVKEVIATIDGSLLDNIVDFVNYTIVPAFFVLVSDIVPYGFRTFIAAVLILSSAYQFSHYEAKTEDHFFRGFPSYWNIVAFYLFMWNMSPLVNAAILLLLAVLVFYPVKYIYPTRMENLSPHATVRRAVVFATIVWGGACLAQLIIYPDQSLFLALVTLGYSGSYLFLSFYRTYAPLSWGIADELSGQDIEH